MITALSLALAFVAPPSPAQAMPPRMDPVVRGAITTRSKIRTQRAQRRGIAAQVAQLQRSVRLQVVQAARRLQAARRSIEAHIAVREQDLRLRHALGEIARPSEPARGDASG